MKLKIKNKEFKVKTVTSHEDKKKGLQGVEELKEDEGMLFVYDEPEDVTFWMKNTPIDLSIIFIDEDKQIIKIVQAKANSEEPIICEDVQYVLEVNKGFKARLGEDVDFEDPIEKREDSYHILDEYGDSQMELVGGERIFSRKNTNILVRLSKKAKESGDDKDYKKLGKKLFQFIEIQNNNEPQYVELNT